MVWKQPSKRHQSATSVLSRTFSNFITYVKKIFIGSFFAGIIKQLQANN